MKKLFLSIAAVLLIIGGVWFLQGIGILPGSVMSGQQFWAYAGGALVVAAVMLAWLGLRANK